MGMNRISEYSDLSKNLFPAWLQNPLAREITLTLVIKLVVIVAFYHAFFADHQVSVNPDTLAEHLANPQPDPRPGSRSVP